MAIRPGSQKPNKIAQNTLTGNSTASAPMPASSTAPPPTHRPGVVSTRRHEINSTLACEAYDCGFAVPNFTPGYAESTSGGTAETHTDTLACTVSSTQGGGTGTVINCDTNTSLYCLNVHIPAVKYRIPSGHTALETKVQDEAL